MVIRTLLGFISLVAFGAIASAVLFVVLSSFGAGNEGHAIQIGGATLQLPSVMFGVIIGLTLGILTRLPWADLPRRLVTWLLIHERDFFSLAVLGGAIGVLLLY